MPCLAEQPGRIHDIRPAKELLETLMAYAAIILKQLSASLQRADTFTSIT
jgi:hypothetical protein